MESVYIRLIIFTILPIVFGYIHPLIFKTDKKHSIEVMLIYLFGFAAAGSGIGNFFSHFFLSDFVAQSIGWETGSPFQLEVAFANLAIGLGALAAVTKRDGFREAVVLMITVFAMGATIVHIMEIISEGNLAPGNTFQIFANFIRPVFLIIYLKKLRKKGTAIVEKKWQKSHGIGIGFLTAWTASGYGLGFALDNVLLWSGIGLGIGVVFLIIAVRKISK